ncbi:MAG: glycosyltransferase family 2 protein [Opitutales bacterium]
MNSKSQRILDRPNIELLSLVFPIYNEEGVIPHLEVALAEWRRDLPFNLEIIFVDDGSEDDSFSLLTAWAERDECIRLYSFSRNFGHQSALSAGLDFARGDAVVTLDADLQDPLEVIFEMVNAYNSGFDIVYGIRRKRVGESMFKRATAWFFYRFMRLFIHPDLPADAGDFRLISRRCLHVLEMMPERDRFLRGMFAWMGFPQTGVYFDRPVRTHGITKFSLIKMLGFALNGVLSFSALPIRIITLAGVFIGLMGFGYGVYVVGRWYVLGDTVKGWPSLIVLLSLIGGMILLGLGIVGEYVSRIYEALKARPWYILKESVHSKPLENE